MTTRAPLCPHNTSPGSARPEARSGDSGSSSVRKAANALAISAPGLSAGSAAGAAGAPVGGAPEVPAVISPPGDPGTPGPEGAAFRARNSASCALTLAFPISSALSSTSFSTTRAWFSRFVERSRLWLCSASTSAPAAAPPATTPGAGPGAPPAGASALGVPCRSLAFSSSRAPRSVLTSVSNLSTSATRAPSCALSCTASTADSTAPAPELRRPRDCPRRPNSVPRADAGGTLRERDCPQL